MPVARRRNASGRTSSDDARTHVQGLLDRDLIVVTGKGGVGTSTVAAALGLLAASRGMRAIVAETGGHADSVRLLAGSGVEHVSISPRAAMEEYLHHRLPSRTLADMLAASGMFASFVTATPGMAELLTIGKAWELAQDDRRTPDEDRYDVVILDAPASGHGLAMLAAPRTFADTARVGPIHRQAGRIDASLRDPSQTAIVGVTTLEEMAVNELLELRAAVRDGLGREIDAVVANAVVADRFSAADVAALRVSEGAAARAALWADARARVQRTQQRRLRAALGESPLRLPQLYADPLGRAEAQQLALALGKRA